MRPIPQIAGSPEHLRARDGLRLRLLLCSEELRARYHSPVFLCGSGLRGDDPKDRDVRVILESAVFDAYDRQYWGLESAMRSEEQRQMNLLPFDVRIYPERLWYRGGALPLDALEFAPAPVAGNSSKTGGSTCAGDARRGAFRPRGAVLCRAPFEH